MGMMVKIDKKGQDSRIKEKKERKKWSGSEEKMGEERHMETDKGNCKKNRGQSMAAMWLIDEINRITRKA